MRFARFVLVLGLVASVSGDAFAKDKDKDKKKKDEGIQETGIESFDAVFLRVDEIDGHLVSADQQLRTGKRNLNTALELKKGTPISDGLAELQARAGDQLQLTLNEKAVPQLTVKDAVPTNVQSAVDAVNGLTLNMSTSLTDLTALQPEIEGLVGEVTAMPARLKDEFSGGSSNIVQQLVSLPKASKALTHDIDFTLGLADRTTSLTTRMTDLMSVVTTTFTPAAGTQPGKAGGKPTGKGKPKHP